MTTIATTFETASVETYGEKKRKKKKKEKRNTDTNPILVVLHLLKTGRLPLMLSGGVL
jgi:hypothetical protein